MVNPSTFTQQPPAKPLHLARRAEARRLWRLLALLVAMGIALVLSACAAKPPPPPPPPKVYQLQLELTVAADANPDLRSRPSPVVLRLYELRSAAQFDSLDFVTLFDKDQAVMASDIVVRDEWVLQPGETRSMPRKLNPETKFVAAVAAYRDVERSVWRSAAQVLPLQDQTLTVQVQRQAVRVSKR
jgi:type VI secretion system protein VasD